MIVTYFEIRVAGQVPHPVLQELRGAGVAVQPVVTRLRGPVADQDELHALISRIQGLSLELIEVRRLTHVMGTPS